MVVIGGEIRMARKVEHQANSLLNCTFYMSHDLKSPYALANTLFTAEVDLAVVVAVTLHRPRRIMGFVSILVSSDGYF